MIKISGRYIYYFSEEDIVVGFPAVDQAEHNPQNTIYDAKRFIGKHFDKQELEVERARYPFKVLQYFCNIVASHIISNENV